MDFAKVEYRPLRIYSYYLPLRNHYKHLPNSTSIQLPSCIDCYKSVEFSLKAPMNLDLSIGQKEKAPSMDGGLPDQQALDWYSLLQQEVVRRIEFLLLRNGTSS